MSQAGEAKQLLGNPVFVEAMATAKSQAINAAMRALPADDLGRFRAIEAAKVVDSVLSHLAAVIQAEDAEEQSKVAAMFEEHYQTQARMRWSDPAISTVRAA